LNELLYTPSETLKVVLKVIEVEVHQQLRAFLRSQAEPYWPHHLTMGRLVARALRLGRSALIQTGLPSVGFYGRHRLSYLMPILMWSSPAILVAPDSVQQRLQFVEIPQLQQWIGTHKTIRTGDRWPGDDFPGLLIISPESWLADRLYDSGRLPRGVPTILDCADQLEQSALQQLSFSLNESDWNQLLLARPDRAEIIRQVRVKLTHSLFQHPANPYQCYLLDQTEQDILQDLLTALAFSPQFDPASNSEPSKFLSLPDSWYLFWQQFHRHDVGQKSKSAIDCPSLLWAEVDRTRGQFTLSSSPISVASALANVWLQQPVVLIGSALDLDSEASIYRQKVGLGDLTCVKFSVDRQNELIQLYLPDRIPMPNTPQFQGVLLEQLRQLLCISASAKGLTVIVVDDVPMKARLGSILAAEFGSRVQVEKPPENDQGILVTGWEYWCQQQGFFPAPKLLAIATLPIPSLENPLVAGRVAYYKQRRQDWFRLYLLPTALNTLQQAIAPLRQTQGVVALLDNRTLHRTYGKEVLAALSPHARIDYLDITCFADAKNN
jgi:ATP-dependent DNA helicase DinG